MLRRSTEHTAPLGVAHRRPELHDHSILLCLTAFKDLLALNPWAREDLLRIASVPGFDSALLADRAKQAGVSTAVWLVSDWLSRDRRGPMWASVRDAIGRRPRRPWLARFYRSRLGRLPAHVDAVVTAGASDDAVRAMLGMALGTLGLARAGARRFRRGDVP